MSSRLSPCSGVAARTLLRSLMKDAQAVAWGVARAADIDAEAVGRYECWIASGRHAAMAYMENHREARNNPSGVLPGVRSVIVAAFSYLHPEPRGARQSIARYGRGRDYHEVVRERLGAVAERMNAEFPGLEWRVAVDTAPLRERYWAQRAGVGFVGKNNTLIVPGVGSWVVLGELLTTLDIEPDDPCVLSCCECGRCVEACPGGALGADGSALDARRCLSYLTIEHRGSFPSGAPSPSTLAGCDICQSVCPHNVGAPLSEIDDFAPVSPLLNMSSDEIMALSSSALRRLTRRTALSRIRPEDLRRNLLAATGSGHGA